MFCPYKVKYIDLAIGDREIDIIPANELGIRTCLFQNRTPGADYYIDSYDQFESVIGFRK
ncbi:hypothetical protein ACFFNY_02385 [Paenibacillus hodogayensis]|uniref:Uncharacterized protein n=1 Tax=Paenibacillus hodogayensis TaxID=279208 RepID=A0ABV5VQ55_9BACL